MYTDNKGYEKKNLRRAWLKTSRQTINNTKYIRSRKAAREIVQFQNGKEGRWQGN